MKVEFVDQLRDDIEKVKEQDLVRYEADAGVDVNYKPFALVLTDNDSTVIGTINAYTAYSEVYIDDIWVHSNHRSKGYGRKLIEALENKFRGKGFNNINLITSQFQAPEFYIKCSFQLEFVRKNLKNPSLTKYFFVKFFDDETQMQGIHVVTK